MNVDLLLCNTSTHCCIANWTTVIVHLWSISHVRKETEYKCSVFVILFWLSSSCHYFRTLCCFSRAATILSVVLHSHSQALFHHRGLWIQWSLKSLGNTFKLSFHARRGKQRNCMMFLTHLRHVNIYTYIICLQFDCMYHVQEMIKYLKHAVYETPNSSPQKIHTYMYIHIIKYLNITRS